MGSAGLLAVLMLLQVKAAERRRVSGGFGAMERPFYGTRVGPGWYQGTTRVLPGWKEGANCHSQYCDCLYCPGFLGERNKANL
jgi:hypothetical protein